MNYQAQIPAVAMMAKYGCTLVRNSCHGSSDGLDACYALNGTDCHTVIPGNYDCVFLYCD